MQQIKDTERLLTCSNDTQGFGGGIILCFTELTVYRKIGLYAQWANSKNMLYALTVQRICWEH